jgi:uncharacterized protein YprB with RNaseH-like and TPR domain
MSQIRRRLDDLKAAARTTPRERFAASAPAARRLDKVIGGRESRCGGLAYWLVETPLEAINIPHRIEPESLAFPLRHESGPGGPVTIDPHRALVLDVETGGFAGVPVFLIGLVLLGRRPLSVLQLLARDYPEEEAILRALAELTGSRDTWVTFNGKSFDEPFLRDRATLHRVPFRPPGTHVDLLHAARRVWRGRLPNFRLGTLEDRVLLRPRIGDIPSSDVPDLFHHFIRTGNAAPLRPVLEHNRIDLVSVIELLVRLSAGRG